MNILRQYPKLLLLACSFLAAYLLFHFGYFDILEETLNGHGYISVFLAGLLFSFGFTTPFGIALFVEVAPHINPFIAAPLGGMGAFLTDLCIFELMRFETFHDEFHRLRQSTVFRSIHHLFHHKSISEGVRLYILWCFAGIIIASPLPDELGISLLGFSKMRLAAFLPLSYFSNFIGIFLIGSVARTIELASMSQIF